MNQSHSLQPLLVWNPFCLSLVSTRALWCQLSTKFVLFHRCRPQKSVDGDWSSQLCGSGFCTLCVLLQVRVEMFYIWPLVLVNFATVCHVRGMVQWWECLSSTNVAQIWFWPGVILCVGWVCCWFSPSIKGFSQVLRFSSLRKKTNILQILIWSGWRTRMKTS